MAIMKNTGMLWLGQIPVDWELGKVKYAFNRKKEKSTEKDPTVLSLARTGVKVRDISTNEGQLAASYEGYNPVEPNDLLLNPMDLVSGANCSISKVSGVISPAYVNLRAKIGVEPRYYDYYFKTQYWNMGFFAHGKGVSFENRWTLNDATLKDYYIPMPLLSEQQTIADYLDETCSKIDEIIAEAKASIDEYKELKQSVIFEAVTKGLDKNVKMKDSGIEWIGEIPVSWDCEKMRYIVNDIGDIDHYMPESVGHGIAYLMTGDLSDKVSNINFEKCKQVSYEDYKKLSKKIKAEIGDIIFARYASIGIVCYVDVDKNFLVSYSCVVIKPKHDIINSLYVKYYLQSKAFKEEVLRLANSNVQMNVGKESLLQAKITVPSLYEQERIVNFLDKRTAEIDSLISEKESLINDLEAYKKSLIYEVVTGKRRVV